MKIIGIFLLTFPVLFFENLSFGQSKTLENGVTVFEATGNETLLNTTPQPINRTVNDWNLAECIEALRSIDEKCSMISQEECANNYNDLKAAIYQRKEQLEN